ncbi:hypothetical protein KUTeg_020862 [Tegillarca granosa]|uniref:FZ domain-containing protein n=1 Tax=Tegillarca granosa TaxID=220873 RepID=A0ABQ9EEK8_TEGGR|nr:hypothetical protein KUTeg_020862 [Tegillarca granosa]
MDKIILVFIVLVGISFQYGFANRCQEIFVPMCRGQIGYTHTKLPNRYGHTTQGQVYRTLARWWRHMDSGCSENLRLTACGLYLPKCSESADSEELPCKETCVWARKFCKAKFEENNGTFPVQELRCRGLRKKKKGACIRPAKRRRNRGQRTQICRRNNVDMCQGLTFNRGTLPNFFNQSDVAQIKAEIRSYQPLFQTNCHAALKFLICGTYIPFCARGNPWALPCREICNNVKQACMSDYTAIYGDIPWPQKFQCHLYPVSTSATDRPVCVQPSDSVLALQ